MSVTCAFRELFRRGGDTQYVPFYTIADGSVQRIVLKFDNYSPRNLALVANAQKDEKVP